MTYFPGLDASASGARVAQQWLTTIADNIANSNTVRPAGQEPFRAHKLVVAPVENLGGVRMVDQVEVTGAPDRVYEPDNPLADAEGFVTRPVVDMTEELTALLIAQRLFQANLQAHSQIRDTYRQALSIGRA